MIKVEIITIGSELLDGRVKDKNSAWLGQFLKSQGLKLRSVTVIADDPDIIQSTLKAATERSEVVLVSGGLGPTEDDRTKYELARFFSKDIVFSETTLEVTKKNYARRNKEFLKEQNTYPQIPQDFAVHENPAGFAPGLSYTWENRFIAAAPGVPREFEQLVEKVYFPLIQKQFSWQQNLGQACICTFSIPEEKIFFSLCPDLWSQLETLGTVSSLPRFPGVNIWVTSENKTSEMLYQELENLLKGSALLPHIWQVGSLPFEQWIVQKFSEHNLTLATAESCTGGLIASSLTDVSGSSRMYMGSVVSYANEVKIQELGVLPSDLEKYGAVSEQVVKSMANGVRQKMQTDYAVSTSGIAGPTGGSAEKPVGTVCIGVATPTEVKSFKFQFHGDREELKQRFASMAKLKIVEEILALLT